MQNQQPLKLLFVINPVSGGKEKQDWEAAIRIYFKDKPQVLEFYVLTGKDDKRSIQYHIETIHPDRVIAVGGDGTVKLLAELLKETTIPLGIIPAGSANGMARELEIPLVAEEALDIIVDGGLKKVDIIKINEEELCVHLSDMGLNAFLVKYFEQSKKRGLWSYGKSLFKMLWVKQKMKATIRMDEGTVKRSAYMVVLANARKYGTGANINPEGDISDGQFEVVVVRKLNVFEIIKSVFTNRSFHPRRIEVFSTQNVELYLQRKAFFQVDGEYRGQIAQLKARILPRALTLLVPLSEAGS
jgi:diacylglycerol kinase family enzyme